MLQCGTGSFLRKYFYTKISGFMVFGVLSSLFLRRSGRVWLVWEELTTTSKLLSSTYFKIKGNCSLKAPKLKYMYIGENTDTNMHIHLCLIVDWLPMYQCLITMFRSLTGRSQSTSIPTALLSLIGAKLSWQLALSRWVVRVSYTRSVTVCVKFDRILDSCNFEEREQLV